MDDKACILTIEDCSQLSMWFSSSLRINHKLIQSVKSSIYFLIINVNCSCSIINVSAIVRTFLHCSFLFCGFLLCFQKVSMPATRNNGTRHGLGAHMDFSMDYYLPCLCPYQEYLETMSFLF